MCRHGRLACPWEELHCAKRYEHFWSLGYMLRTDVISRPDSIHLFQKGGRDDEMSP